MEAQGRERLVVVGNGMAGCRAIEEILKRDPERYQITVFGAEPRVNYNRIMPGHKIAMPQPLTDGQVDYPDGTPTTVLQYARDVAAFLQWAAEPSQTQRKQTGFTVMVFLVIFSLLLYYTKKKIWASAHAH